MIFAKKHVAFVLVIAASLVTGCSSSTTQSPTSSTGKTDAGATSARPKTKPKTSTLKGKAGPTPPSGAKSAGVQTKPKVGTTTVPITNVEVYTFEESFAADAPPDVVSWAYVEGVGTYLWINGSVTCDDGSVDSNAGFLMEVLPDGTGSYLFSLPGCPSSDLFGCDFDANGNETTCGACQVDGDALVCAVAGQ